MSLVPAALPCGSHVFGTGRCNGKHRNVEGIYEMDAGSAHTDS